MSIVQLSASRDAQTGQVYVPPRALAADGSLRATENIEVPAQGVLVSWTSFAGEYYGLIDLDCGARIQALLAPGTDKIGTACTAKTADEQGQPRFSHD